MVQRLVEDPDGNMALECDSEGLSYLIMGLEDLEDCYPGTTLSTPSVWVEPAPWWRFWNRSGTPVVGEMRLRRVADE